MRDSFINGLPHLMKSWKSIRSQMTNDLSDIDHLKMVCEFWSSAPISKRTLNWDNPEEWPDPWKLIANMEFDESSISLGMKYTLELSKDSRWNSNRCSLMLIKDNIIHIQGIVLLIDNKWLLNYDYKSIINIENNPQNYIIQQRYSYNGKLHFITDIA